MDRHTINRVSGIAPIVLSLLAFGVVIVAVLTGWGKGYKDEGPAAHIFQLLIAAEIPLILVFVATLEGKRKIRGAGLIGLQGAALAIALAPVGLLKL